MNSNDYWRFKQRIIEERGDACERCHDEQVRLELHHLNYDNLGHEKDEDVILLCIPCHEAEHDDEDGGHTKGVNTYMSKVLGEGGETMFTWNEAVKEFDEWLENKS